MNGPGQGMSDEELAAEADVFGCYLVGRPPAAELVVRYREACRRLWPDGPAGPDAARLAFVRRHPWSVGPLDAAAALLDASSQLRSRVLVAAAILEATPTHADDFLPRSVTLLGLVPRLVLAGTVAASMAVLGALLWRLAGRSRA